MNALSWFDNRTILACQALVTGLFGCSLYAIHLFYPRMRGIRTMAIAFLIGLPATILVSTQGAVPVIFSMWLANAGIYLSYLFMYRGLSQHFGDSRHLKLAYSLYAIACCSHLYFTIGHSSLAARIVTASLTLGSIRVLDVILLARHSSGSLHRKLFAATIGIFAFIGLLRTPLTLIHGAPQNFMHQNAVQTYMLLMGLAFLCVDGAFYLTLVTFAIARDITRTGELDPLTNVLNRRGIEQRLNDELSRSLRTGSVLGLMLIDLDHLKRINDTQGHAAGDASILNVAIAIRATLRPYDHLGRFGGDEFLVLLPETSIVNAQTIAERFAQSLEAQSLSIGIAQSSPTESAESLLARADSALYRAKRDGRNCIRTELTAPTPLHVGG